MNLRRVRTAAVGAALVALSAAACTTHAGSSAQVGSSTISTSTLRGLVQRGSAAVTANPTAGQTLDPAALQRKLLSLLVTDKLVAEDADRLGVSVNQQEIATYDQAFGALNFGSVAKFHQQLAAAGVGPSDTDLYVRYAALQEAIEDKISPAPAISDANLRQQYDAVVKQTGKIPLSFDDAKPWIERFIADQTRSVALTKQLTGLADATRISINPRFGKWDASQLGVVAADGSVATKVAPAPSSAATQ